MQRQVLGSSEESWIAVEFSPLFFPQFRPRPKVLSATKTGVSVYKFFRITLFRKTPLQVLWNHTTPKQRT